MVNIAQRKLKTYEYLKSCFSILNSMEFKKIYLIFAFLSVGVFLIDFGSAWWNDNGSPLQNVTDCGTLSTAGATYTLQNNVSTTGTCFTITADNITLDGHGYSLIGTGGDVSGYGIYADSRNNLTIKNFATISGFDYISRTSYSGIYFRYINNSVIQNVNTSKNNRGFSSLGAYNNSFNLLVSSGNYDGIRLSGSNNIFYNSTISSNDYIGLYFSGSNNTFYNALVYSNLYRQIGSANWNSSTGNILIYNNSFGKISFVPLTSNINSDIKFGVGQPIQIANNSAYVNSSALNELNVSANITFYNTPYLYPKLLKDGNLCSDCVLLSSSGTNHTFNVSSWSNYTIAENTGISSCRDLTSANTIYTLQNDISRSSTCLTINADNVTLDGNGYGASAYGPSSSAIRVSKNYSTIRNFRDIANSRFGLSLDSGTRGAVVENNTIRAGFAGIQVSSSNSNIFINNNVYSFSSSSFSGVGGTNNSLIYNNLFGQYILLDSARKNNLTLTGDVFLGRTINISDNLISIDDNVLPGLNVSANITFYNTPYLYPKLLKDGNSCSAPNCNLLFSSGTNHTFNVSGFSNYTLTDTTDLTTCRDLVQANTVYTLQNNVSTTGTCFNITANNVTFDLNGYNVTGEEVGAYGVHINNINNTILKNGKIINFTNAGILLDSSFYSNVTNLSLENDGEGIKLDAGSTNFFSNLYISNNFYGFSFYNVPLNNLLDSIILSANVNALMIFSGTNNTLINVSFVNSTNVDLSYVSSGLSPPPAGTLFNTSFSFIDMVIGKYSLQSNSQKLIGFERSHYGKILFLDQISGTSTNLSRDIQIANGSAYVNSSAISGLNKSANITFYNLPTKVSEMYNASVLFNEGNGKMSCANCNILSSSDSDSSVVFNVSDFGNSRNYSVGGVDVVQLNAGWNSVSFIMDGLTNSSKNISVSAGWNLIGFSSSENLNVSLINFTTNSGIKYTWNNAVINNKTMNDVYYYNSVSKTFESSTNLSNGKGYWIYALEAGNVTLPSVLGSRVDKNYLLSNLTLVNSSGVEKNITEANLSNWINISRIYSFNTTSFNTLDYQLNSSSSWRGYVFWSNQNLSLLRRD